MSLRIASWNIEGRLSHAESKKRGGSNQIIAAIKKLDADILVLLEAHCENSLDNLKPLHQLTSMGYSINNVPYGDDTALREDAVAPQLSLILLSKLPVDKFEIIRLGDVRNAFSAIIHDVNSTKPLRIIGLHLDDRSESTRLKQVTDLSKIVNQTNIPTVVLGDFNAMHGEDIYPSKLLRSKPARYLAKKVIPDISLRAVEMATGSAIHLLQSSTGLRDADINHRPTTTPKIYGLEWLPSIRLIQIDHIFISDNITVNKFQIAADGGADHRAIVATLSFNHPK